MKPKIKKKIDEKDENNKELDDLYKVAMGYREIFFLAAPTIIFLVFIFVLLLGLLLKISTYFTSYFSQVWINLIGVVLIAIFGTGLYVFRERKRIYYGIVETSFALAYGWYAINKVAEVGYVETVSIIAAIYLVVRGIDNFMEGVKQVEEANTILQEEG